MITGISTMTLPYRGLQTLSFVYYKVSKVVLSLLSKPLVDVGERR